MAEKAKVHIGVIGRGDPNRKTLSEAIQETLAKRASARQESTEKQDSDGNSGLFKNWVIVVGKDGDERIDRVEGRREDEFNKR